MAGETKGKTYEALVKIALDDLIKADKLAGKVFWNQRPSAMTIEPDFTIGQDKDHPTHVFLVTHSGSAKESEKKFWRNIGELAEAKSVFEIVPRVISIAFDDEIKEDLKEIQKSAFDGHLIVGAIDYGTTLCEWIEEHATALPSEGEDKAKQIRLLAASNPSLLSAISKLTNSLGKAVLTTQPELEKLWTLHRKRRPSIVATAKDTFYRRAFAKLSVLGVAPDRLVKPLSGNYDWAVDLGLVKKSIGGYRICDDDLMWLAKSELRDVNPSCWTSAFVSDGFVRQAQKVRSVALLSEYQSYVIKHLTTLQNPAGMKKHLLQLHADPGKLLSIPKGMLAPQTVWLFDYIGALVKASAKKSQAFGFASFSNHAASRISNIGNMPLGTWCTCFMNQFFNRKKSFAAPTEAIDLVSQVLAEKLQSFTSNSINKLADKVEEKYIAKEFTAVLLAHRGFDPIGALLDQKMPHLMESLRIRAGFAERCVSGGIAASTGVAKIGSSLINWQSAHDSHTNDKRKELCGRAPALRYAWDVENSMFVKRPGVEKLILIVDGTWQQSDLNALAQAGWDGIFYPDEMDKVMAAVV